MTEPSSEGRDHGNVREPSKDWERLARERDRVARDLGSRSRWNHRFMHLAQFVGAWSKDPEHRIGAAVVGTDNRDIAVGYNGFPRGVTDAPDRLNHKPIKRIYTIHAELNALLNAHFDVKGGTLYVTKFPCHECAKAIVQRGVSELVTPKIAFQSSYTESSKHALDMFQEAGVKITIYHDEGLGPDPSDNPGVTP